MTRARDVADAGHSTTATTADTISQKTSINLSGTYSTHQLLVADAYTFAGDTTVNDNLILGKLSDDGTDTVLEGSHTLQGTGQLEAGYVTSSGIGSVDGMTGTLGSGVSIPAVGITGTLGSGVFPAGHILQTQMAEPSAYNSTTSYSSTSLIPLGSCSITPLVSNSYFLILHTAVFGRNAGGRNQWLVSKAYTAGVNAYGDTTNRIFFEHYADYYAGSTSGLLYKTKSYYHTSRAAPAGTEITYYLFGGVIEAATMDCWNQQIVLMEIQP